MHICPLQWAFSGCALCDWVEQQQQHNLNVEEPEKVSSEMPAVPSLFADLPPEETVAVETVTVSQMKGSPKILRLQNYTLLFQESFCSKNAELTDITDNCVCYFQTQKVPIHQNVQNPNFNCFHLISPAWPLASGPLPIPTRDACSPACMSQRSNHIGCILKSHKLCEDAGPYALQRDLHPRISCNFSQIWDWAPHNANGDGKIKK